MTHQRVDTPAVALSRGLTPSAPEAVHNPNHPLLHLQRLVGNRATVSLLDPPPASQAPPAEPVPVGSHRKTAFVQRAAKFKLSADQAEHLWQVGGGSTADGDGFVPAEGRTGELFGAARAAARSGAPTYYLSYKVIGLAELNAGLGHSRADAALEEARTKVHADLASSVTNLTPIRDRAAGFGFVVSCDPESGPSPQALTALAHDVGARVGGPLGLDLDAEVMDVDEAATMAVKGDLRRAPAPAAEASPTKPSRSGARFTSTGADRRQAFLTAAAGYKMDDSEAEELYGVLLSSRADTVTGFERGADRESTVLKAIEYAANGMAAVYVEIDVRNLGGLTKALGRSKADKVFADIAGIAEREMAGVGDLGDAWPFRHGGDEFSFVVVGRRTGITASQLEFAVGAALTRAVLAIREATAAVDFVPHTKPGRPPGTGIVWGTSVIDANSVTSKVFSEADTKVEAKKKGA